MLTPSSALLWEVWRPLRWRIPVILCVLLFVPGVLLIDGLQNQSQNQHYRRIMVYGLMQMAPPVQLGLNLVNSLICILLIGQAVGAATRHYAFPISSQLLATIRLVPGGIASAGLYCTVAAIVNQFCSTEYHWPYVSPALTYGVGYMLMYAAINRFRGNENRMGIAGLFVGVCLLFWIGRHYGPRWWIQIEHAWPELSASEAIILLVAAFVAWVSQVDSLARDRRGAGWGRVRPAIEPMGQVLSRDWRPPRPFASSWTALFWREWKQDGLLLPCVMTMFLTLFATISLFFLMSSADYRRSDNDHLGLTLGATTAFLSMCVAAPWFVSLSGGPGKRVLWQLPWPTSQSTLPVSDATLGTIIFARSLASVLVAAIGVILVGAIWFGGVKAVLHYHGLDVARSWAEPVNLTRSGVPLFTGGLFFAAWMTSGWATAATLSGRRWIALLPIGVIPAWIAFLFVIFTFLDDTTASSLMEYVQYLVLGVLLFGTVLAYVIGVARDVLTTGTLLFGGATLLITEVVGVMLMYQSAETQGVVIPNANIRLFMLCLALAAAPPALIPLATHYNRHR